MPLKEETLVFTTKGRSTEVVSIRDRPNYHFLEMWYPIGAIWNIAL